MDMNAISNVTANVASTYSASTKESTEKATSEDTSKKNTGFSEEAAVYEKSNSDSVKSYSKNSSVDRTALVEQMKADTERLKNNLLDIVKKSISGQGNAFAIASEDDMWKMIASGNFTADADSIAQAKKDIAEDGYWGVEQTSSRIVDFAIALSGNNTEKADLMINAFKKGFEQATGTWGKDLPEISQNTYDKVLEKFDSWKNGTYPAAEEAAATEQ